MESEYKLLSFKRANDKKHKYKVELLDMNTDKKFSVKFGAYGMNDYTIYTKNNDPDKDKYKRQYLNRHRKNEDWKDIQTAGAWSRWVLWNKGNVDDSLLDMIKKFKIQF